MNLDDLERYCEELPIDMEDLKKYEIRPDFIVFLANHMPGLIRVAKAVKDERMKLCQCGFLEITRALEELEKE